MKQNINPSLLNGNFKKEDNASSGLRRSFSQGSLASCETNFNPDEIDLKLEEQDKKLEKLESIILSLLTQNEEQRVQLEEQKKLLQEQQANSSSKIMELEGALENAVKSTKDFKDIISAKLQADAIAQQSAIEQRSLTIQADLKRSITSLKQEQEKDKQEITFLYSKELPNFLNLVACGEQQKAEQTLKIARRLATMSGDLTDLANREFKNITAFQYAVWALDYHMWTMIRNYLTDDQVREQLVGLNSAEWIAANGIHGKQVSWQNLIDALETYVKSCVSWNREQCRGHWISTVGNAQLKLPAHVIQEYMSENKMFDCNPPFDRRNLIRTAIGSQWVEPVAGYKLGISGAYSGCGWNCFHTGPGTREDWLRVGSAAKENLTAVRSLFEIRSGQRAELERIAQVAKMPVPRPKP